MSPPKLLLLALSALTFLGIRARGHGFFEKPLWNQGKENGTSRGQAGTNAVSLWMMQPARYSTGRHQTVGFKLTAQDEEASTPETVTIAYVPYAKNGILPDPSQSFARSTFRLFGMGDKGIKAYAFLVTIGFPKKVPDRFGIQVDLPPAPKWPSDGISIHGQFNLPKDSRRPRVPPPWDKQVFAFQRPSGTKSPAPHHGRTLDVLQITGVYFEPALRTYLRSPAYGLGTETLHGLEAVHPVASRKDAFGFEFQGGQIGSSGFGFLFLSNALSPKPIPGPVGAFFLAIKPPFPILLDVLKLDGIGNGKTGTWPVSLLPAALGDIWFQIMVVNPVTREYEYSDAVAIRRV